MSYELKYKYKDDNAAAADDNAGDAEGDWINALYLRRVSNDEGNEIIHTYGIMSISNVF